MAAAQRIKVLVDTDIGTDPDDGMALSYLASHPSCDLLGITLVSGDVQKRAAVAEVLLRACGLADVPIHCGRRTPLLKGAGQPQVEQYQFVEHQAHAGSRPENTAVDFMRRTIRENPGEVVLLTIGPLSNVGLLFALDPELPSLCRDIVSMCGKFFSMEKHKKEWNVLVDETAAGMVLRAARPRHRFVGLDVTRPCTLQRPEAEARLFQGMGGHFGDLMQSLGGWWLERKGRLTFHDPLAAAMIFEPNLCEWRSGRVVVDPANGATSFEEGQGDDLVACGVQPIAFFEHYFDTIKVRAVASPQIASTHAAEKEAR